MYLAKKDSFNLAELVAQVRGEVVPTPTKATMTEVIYSDKERKSARKVLVRLLSLAADPEISTITPAIQQLEEC